MPFASLDHPCRCASKLSVMMTPSKALTIQTRCICASASTGVYLARTRSGSMVLVHSLLSPVPTSSAAHRRVQTSCNAVHMTAAPVARHAWLGQPLQRCTDVAQLLTPRSQRYALLCVPVGIGFAAFMLQPIRAFDTTPRLGCLCSAALPSHATLRCPQSTTTTSSSSAAASVAMVLPSTQWNAYVWLIDGMLHVAHSTARRA